LELPKEKKNGTFLLFIFFSTLFLSHQW